MNTPRLERILVFLWGLECPLFIVGRPPWMTTRDYLTSVVCR
jgi:hypothetical protein